MRILVTGGAGFIGSHLAEALLARGHDVTVLDKLTYAGSERNLAGLPVELVRGDVAEAGDVRPLMDAGRFDRVAHLAAESHVDRSLADPRPFFRTNVLGTRVMLDEARRAGVARFLHVSTDEVYGPVAQDLRADEGHPLRPTSPYAISKAEADAHALAASEDMPVVIARPTNNYGPRQHPEKALPLFLTNAWLGLEVPLYGDGLHERDWLHVSDCAEALARLLLADRAREAVYNIGFGMPRPNLEVARMLLEFAGVTAGTITHVADRSGHDRRYAVDSSRIAGEFGWRPRIELDEGLKSMVAWYRANESAWRAARSGEFQRFYRKNYGNGSPGR